MIKCWIQACFGISCLILSKPHWEGGAELICWEVNLQIDRLLGKEVWPLPKQCFNSERRDSWGSSGFPSSEGRTELVMEVQKENKLLGKAIAGIGKA